MFCSKSRFFIFVYRLSHETKVFRYSLCHETKKSFHDESHETTKPFSNETLVRQYPKVMSSADFSLCAGTAKARKEFHFSFCGPARSQYDLAGAGHFASTLPVCCSIFSAHPRIVFLRYSWLVQGDPAYPSTGHPSDNAVRRCPSTVVSSHVLVPLVGSAGRRIVYSRTSRSTHRYVVVYALTCVVFLVDIISYIKHYVQFFFYIRRIL